jgi:signal transduction histidine kinase
VLFAAGFTAIFFLLYVLLGRQLESREVESLKLRLQQYSDIYEARGLVGMRERIAEDSEAPNVRSLFVRLVGPRGNAVWGKIPPDWIDQDARRVAVPDGWGGWNVRSVYSVRVPRDQRRDLVLVSSVLPDGLLLQVGRSTDSRETLLEPLRGLFLRVAGGVVLVGFLIGYIAANRATRPLRNVVETARRIITTGALDARVPQPRRDDDVAELVRHFNTVLDKNAALLKAMREALDNVAHDLRTPLTSLRGTAELALTQTGNEAATRDALGECVERADDVLLLLRALMEISEAEAGVLKLNRADVDLGELARAAVDLYSDVAEARDLRLSLDLRGETPVSADTTRLRQAVANLLDNAVKYTPPGGAVTVTAERRGETVVLTVSDTGPGIPEAEQPRVWERLYRGDQSRSQSGLGLGLSLVRAIVEAHGGTVGMHNGPGGGAVFEVALPARAG